MSECILKCPRCGKRQTIDKDIYDHCMEIRKLAENENIPCMPHPFTCGECGEELELWLPLNHPMKYGFGYDL